MSDTSSIPTETDAAQKSQNSQNAAALACPKCAASKIAKSHPKNLDELSMRFIPKRPYRCLHCYHRFWKWESPFASRRRIWTWSILLIGLSIVVLIKSNSSGNTEVDIGPFYEANESDNGVPEIPPDRSKTVIPRGGSENGSSSAIAATKENQSVASQPSSKEKGKFQLAQARAEVEEIKRLNQDRKVRLEQTMLAERAELESLLKVDIGYHVENWRKAWQAGNIERYLGFYSERFRPRNNVSLEGWRELRQQRVVPTKKIKLTLSNFEVEFADNYNQSKVTFDQSYISGTYRDSSRKQLFLLKERQEWKIVAELEIKQ